MTWTTAGPPPAVPGFIIGARLGVGSSGSVWRARAVLGGPELAVKVVRAGPDAERELAVLRAVANPHVVRLHQAVVLDDDRLALVLDLVDGGTFASVVAARGHLSPGEVVTVLAPLAQAVADLHADGVQHGDLAPGNVLFDHAGRPVLSDLGTARITGEPRDEVFGTAGYVDPVILAGGRAGPPSDVYGLGALAWFGLTGSPPESAALRVPLRDLAPRAGAELVAAVEAAVDPDPRRRPAPAAFAGALYDAAAATPVWLAGAEPSAGGLTHRMRVMASVAPDHAAAARRHRALRLPRHRALVAAVATSVLALVAFAGWWWWPGSAGGRQQPAAVVRTQAPGPTVRQSLAVSVRTVLDPAQVAAEVRELSGRRAALFAHPRRPVTDVAVPGSPAFAADEASLKVLRAAGLAYRGLELRAAQVHVVKSAPRRVIAEVLTTATAYDVVDRRGASVAHVSAEPDRPVRLVLALTESGWRVQAVLSS